MPSPKRWRQIRIGTLLLSVAVGAPLLGSKLHDLLVFARAGTAYSAKVLCSSVLMAGLTRPCPWERRHNWTASTACSA